MAGWGQVADLELAARRAWPLGSPGQRHRHRTRTGDTATWVRTRAAVTRGCSEWGAVGAEGAPHRLCFPGEGASVQVSLQSDGRG